MTMLFVFLLVALVFSFLCSMWEAVLLSVTPSYAQIKIAEGSGLGMQLRLFKENIDRPLAAILTLNTIAHTVGAIGVGAQANRIWADSNPWVTTVVVPATMTLAILLLSEIIPKTIGANAWRRLVPFTVRSLQALIALLAPLVALSQLVTRLLKHDKAIPVLTRSDFLAMTKIGERAGVIDDNESSIISNLFRFRSVRVRDVMTPRTVVMAAPAEQSIGEFLDENPDVRFSRIPLYSEGVKDHVVGFVLKADLLSALVGGRAAEPLGSIVRELTVIPDAALLAELFRRLLEDREHIALVVDEFGGMAGIVTMEDVIETLLGMEIVDELDHTEDMQALARRLWRRRAERLGLVDADGEPPER